MMSIRRFGVPSKSNAVPGIPGAKASSAIEMAGAATCWPSLPDKHDRPSASARPPNPMYARKATSVATAAGSRTTSYRPSSRSRGRCDSRAFPAALRPMDSRSTLAASTAHDSTYPAPPSPPLTSAVTLAWVVGP